MKGALRFAGALMFAGWLTVDVLAQTGSLWQGESVTQSLFADHVGDRVGDLVTIIINLQTQATKNQQTDSSKAASVNDVLTTLLYPETAGPLNNNSYDFYRLRDRNNPNNSLPPTFAWDATHKFSGGGKINNSEALVTTIQARIVDVAPNGVLQIEARRQYEIGNEKSELVLTGSIRREDLTQDNTVESSRIADLQVRNEGTGALSREQNKGWLTKLYEILSPF